MIRRLAIPAVLAALVAGGFLYYIKNRGTSAARFPGANVLLISVDTLRADALGFMGSTTVKTPNLDALAKESIVFDRAMSSANDTGASHASMLTGMAVPVHGVLNFIKGAPHRIPEAIPTLAERLKREGYRTAAETDGGYVTNVLGFDRGFDHFKGITTGSGKRVPDVIRWFEELEPGKPGFFFFHTYDTHAPYPMPPAQIDRFAAKFPGSVVPGRMKKFFQKSGDWDFTAAAATLFENFAQFTDNDRACLRACYDFAVEKMDRSMGVLLDALRAKGFYDNAIIIFTSDHGEEFGEHGKYQHETLYDEIMHVPLAIRLPKGARGGARAPFLIGSIDLVPTILDLLGFPAPSDVEGESRLASIFGNDPEAERRVVFATLDAREAISGFAARTENAKLIAWTRGEHEIKRAFDLRADPLEKKPVELESNKNAVTLDDALRVARRLWDSLGGSAGGSHEDFKLDEETLNELRRLGYIK
ncbi:MAG: sulfatase [Planctomycetes bacterium]|nr:sulfatase [Planctomycetota bacterium]